MIVEVQIFEVDVVKVKVGMLVYFIILGELEECFSIILCVIEFVFDLINDEIIIILFSLSSSFSFIMIVIYYNGLFDVVNLNGVLCILMIVQVYIVLYKVEDVVVILVIVLENNNGCY